MVLPVVRAGHGRRGGVLGTYVSSGPSPAEIRDNGDTVARSRRIYGKLRGDTRQITFGAGDFELGEEGVYARRT